MPSEHADKIVPWQSLIAPNIDQLAIGIFCQRREGIGIKAVAIDRIAVNGSSGWSNQEKIAIWLDDPYHLGKGKPEELAMFKGLPG